MDDLRLESPSVARNRDAIIAALRPILPGRGTLLEIASGSGEHARAIAQAFPGLTIQPSDPSPEARASIDAWAAGHPRIRAALALDAAATWPPLAVDAILCVNMIHIAPWAATLGLLAGAAATYGDGNQGYDDAAALATLRPLNLYGWSKHLFDQAVAKREALPPFCCGLKFFNVYGPNEQHKGPMRSVVHKVFETLSAGGTPELFRSHRAGYADGEQVRDFVFVDDVVDVVLWLLGRGTAPSLLNIGAGVARSWLDLVRAVGTAMGREVTPRFIDMPEPLRARYQYHTLAALDRLRGAGWNAPMTSLEEGVARTVAVLQGPDPYR